MMGYLIALCFDFPVCNFAIHVQSAHCFQTQWAAKSEHHVPTTKYKWVDNS